MTERSRKTLTRFDDYREMMADQVRLEAYQAAIGAVVKPGDVFVDLGAGLGILSMMAVRAGAKHVFAIEKGDSAELGQRIVEANGLSERITYLLAHSFDVELPEKADLLISETLGSFGLEENTLPFMVDARDRFLKAGGVVLPSSLCPMLAPVELPGKYEELLFWRDVSGFAFTPALEAVLSRMTLTTIKPENLLAAAVPFVELDFQTVRGKGVSGRLRFQMERPGTIFGLGAWFEATLASGITLSTAPHAPPTHWKQGFFPFRSPINVVEKDILEVRLQIKALDTDGRADDSTIQYDYRCTQLANRDAT